MEKNMNEDALMLYQDSYLLSQIKKRVSFSGIYELNEKLLELEERIKSL